MQRWRTAGGEHLAARVLARLVHGASLGDLPLDTHGGRTDLRGFAVPDPKVISAAHVGDEDSTGTGLEIGLLEGLIEVRSRTWEGLDLTGAKLGHLRFFGSTLRDVVLDKASCDDWRGWEWTVEDCSFREAKLRGAALGTPQDGGNHFRAVSFAGADLRGSVWSGSSLVDVDFTGAKFDSVEFTGCAFAGCTFTGLLDEVRFAGPPAQKSAPTTLGVDLSEATLRYVEFRGYDLSSTTFPPESDDQVVVRHYPCVVRRAAELLDGDFDAGKRRLKSRMRGEAGRLDDKREVGFFHVDELGKTPEQQTAARDLLHRLERECGEA